MEKNTKWIVGSIILIWFLFFREHHHGAAAPATPKAKALTKAAATTNPAAMPSVSQQLTAAAIKAAPAVAKSLGTFVSNALATDDSDSAASTDDMPDDTSDDTSDDDS